MSIRFLRNPFVKTIMSRAMKSGYSYDLFEHVYSGKIAFVDMRTRETSYFPSWWKACRFFAAA